jgi:hypothetical protein
MGGVRRVAKFLGQAVLFWLVLLISLGALVWFYEGGRYGQGPSILSWIVAGLAMVVISAIAVAVIAKLAGWSQQTVSSIVTVICVVGLVAAFVWVRFQEDPLREALQPVCRGELVSGAAEAIGSAPLRIVVLGNDGERIDWTGHEADWRASGVGDAALVACVERDDTVIETCSYRGGSDVTRYIDVVRVRVVAARTGATLGSFTLNGPEPRACEYSEKKSVTRIDGDDVPFETLSARLATYAGS